MPLNILKLCVGVAEISELEHWQKRRLEQGGRIYHVTRMVPRRKKEIIDGGSIYWVMRGNIVVRQKITDIEEFVDIDGVRRCRLVFDKELVPVRPTPKRAFQGWRYLTEDAAPADLTAQEKKNGMSPEMHAELSELGLI